MEECKVFVASEVKALRKMETNTAVKLLNDKVVAYADEYGKLVADKATMNTIDAVIGIAEAILVEDHKFGPIKTKRFRQAVNDVLESKRSITATIHGEEVHLQATDEAEEVCGEKVVDNE